LERSETQKGDVDPEVAAAKSIAYALTHVLYHLAAAWEELCNARNLLPDFIEIAARGLVLATP